MLRRIIIMTLLIVMATTVSAQGVSPFDELEGQEVAYTLRSRTSCIDDVCTLTSGPRYAEDEKGRWVPLGDLSNWKGTGHYECQVKEDDETSAECLGFNQSDIWFKIKIKDDTMKNKKIKVKVWERVWNETTESWEKKEKKDKEKEVKLKSINDEVIITTERVHDDEIHIGEESTTIYLNSSSTDGDYADMSCYNNFFGSAQDSRAFFKIDMSSVPGNSIIDSATLKVDIISVGAGWDDDGDVYRVANQAWTEATSCTTVYGYSRTNQTHSNSLFTASGWRETPDITDIIEYEYQQGSDYASLAIIDPDSDSAAAGTRCDSSQCKIGNAAFGSSNNIDYSGQERGAQYEPTLIITYHPAVDYNTSVVIISPTTASPASVSTGDNLTVTFNVTYDGKVTSGVSVNNITVGGTEAKVVVTGGVVPGEKVSIKSGLAGAGSTVTFTFADNFDNTSYSALVTSVTDSDDVYSQAYVTKAVGSINFKMEDDWGGSETVAANSNVIVIPYGSWDLVDDNSESLKIRCGVSGSGSSGTYTFPESMPDTDYAIICAPQDDSDSPACGIVDKTTTTADWEVYDDVGSAESVSSTNYCLFTIGEFTFGDFEVKTGTDTMSASSEDVVFDTAMPDTDYAAIVGNLDFGVVQTGWGQEITAKDTTDFTFVSDYHGGSPCSNCNYDYVVISLGEGELGGDINNTHDEFAYNGDLWEINLTAPNHATGLKDLFINISYDDEDGYDTETGAVDYGGAGDPCDPPESGTWYIPEGCMVTMTEIKDYTQKGEEIHPLIEGGHVAIDLLT